MFNIQFSKNTLYFPVLYLIANVTQQKREMILITFFFFNLIQSLYNIIFNTVNAVHIAPKTHSARSLFSCILKKHTEVWKANQTATVQ